MEGIDFEELLRVQSEQGKKAEECCRDVFVHKFRREFQNNIRRKTLADGMVSVNRAGCDPVEKLFTASSPATPDDILDENASENIRARARNMVDEYNHLYDEAVLFFCDPQHARNIDKKTDELRSSLRHVSYGGSDAVPNPIVCKIATSYESIVGGMDQFMRHTACLCKAATIMVGGCDEVTGEAWPDFLKELHRQWQAYHGNVTTDDHRVCYLPNVLIVASRAHFVIHPAEERCDVFLNGICRAQFTLNSVMLR